MVMEGGGKGISDQQHSIITTTNNSVIGKEEGGFLFLVAIITRVCVACGFSPPGFTCGDTKQT